MKILYAMQGTGNGHVSRAREVIPFLQSFAQVDLFLSGDQREVALPVEAKFVSNGLCFLYDKKGGVSVSKTFFKNSPKRLLQEVLNLPVEEYDLVINDFEFISAWACKLRGVRCVGLSHQLAFASECTPRPKKKSLLGEMILRFYSPVREKIAFHFKPYDDFIFPPVVRSEVRRLKPTVEGHYTVYLPAFGEKALLRLLGHFPEIHWEVFSKFSTCKTVVGNVSLFPVNSEDYLKSVESAQGVLCGAGFEGPAEALYLGKKLLVIPIKGQYEQHCNAAALEELGVKVAWSKSELEICLREWLPSDFKVQLEFPDSLEEILLPLLKPNENPYLEMGLQVLEGSLAE